MRIAEFVGAAIVAHVLGGPRGLISLIGASVVKINRRRKRVRLSRPS